jgi:hypothetical protein
MSGWIGASPIADPKGFVPYPTVNSAGGVFRSVLFVLSGYHSTDKEAVSCWRTIYHFP